MSFLRSKILLLRKQHHQTTKPRFFVQKSRLERYLELLTRIMLITLLRKLVRSYTPLEFPAEPG